MITFLLKYIELKSREVGVKEIVYKIQSLRKIQLQNRPLVPYL